MEYRSHLHSHLVFLKSAKCDMEVTGVRVRHNPHLRAVTFVPSFFVQLSQKKRFAQMPELVVEMHQIQFRLGLHPKPHQESSQCSSQTLWLDSEAVVGGGEKVKGRQ